MIETPLREVDLNIVITHILQWGDGKLSNNANEHLFSLVHIYIKKSKIF